MTVPYVYISVGNRNLTANRFYRGNHGPEQCGHEQGSDSHRVRVHAVWDRDDVRLPDRRRH